MLPCNPLKGQTLPSYKIQMMCVFEIIFKECINCSQGHKPAVIQYSETGKYEENLPNLFYLRRDASNRKQIFGSFTGLKMYPPPVPLQEKQM